MGCFPATTKAFNRGAVSPALQIMNSKPPLLKPRSFLSVKEKQESCLLNICVLNMTAGIACMCVYVCVYTHAHVGTCVYIYVEARC